MSNKQIAAASVLALGMLATLSYSNRAMNNRLEVGGGETSRSLRREMESMQQEMKALHRQVAELRKMLAHGDMGWEDFYNQVIAGSTPVVEADAQDEVQNIIKKICIDDDNTVCDDGEQALIMSLLQLAAAGDANANLAEDEAQAAEGMVDVYDLNADGSLGEGEEAALAKLITKGVRIDENANIAETAGSLKQSVKIFAGSNFSPQEGDRVAAILEKTASFDDSDGNSKEISLTEATKLAEFIAVADTDGNGDLSPAEEAELMKALGLTP